MILCFCMTLVSRSLARYINSPFDFVQPAEVLEPSLQQSQTPGASGISRLIEGPQASKFSLYFFEGLYFPYLRYVQQKVYEN